MSLRKYYLLGLIPILIIASALIVVDLGYLNIILFLLSFVFPYSVHTPGLREKVARDQYRFSFLRFCLVIYDFAYDLVPRYKQGIVSLIYPLVFGLILTVMTSEVNIQYILSGWLCWMIFYKFVFREDRLPADDGPNI